MNQEEGSELIPAFVRDALERLEALLDPERLLLIPELVTVNSALNIVTEFGRWWRELPEEQRDQEAVGAFLARAKSIRDRALQAVSRMKIEERGGTRTAGFVPVRIMQVFAGCQGEHDGTRWLLCQIEGEATAWAPEGGPETKLAGDRLVNQVLAVYDDRARFTIHIKIPREPRDITGG